MAGAGMVLVVVVALLVGGSYAKSLNLPADVDDTTATWTEAESSPWGGLVRCVLDPRPLDCVESRSQRAVDAMLAPGGRAASGDTALEPEIVEKVTELSETMVEAAASVMGRKIGLSEGSTDLVEEGRGKKKKKIHKLIALVKLVLLVLVVKLKLAFLMMALQTLFQFKLVVMVFLILITKKISLWATLKSKHQEAQKVIYYEHAQHQHHYDDHGGWSGGHDEHAESGHGGGAGWGNLWGRSYDTVPQTEHAAAAAASTGTVGVQSGVYRAADGSRIVIGQPDAQELAYAAQRP